MHGVTGQQQFVKQQVSPWFRSPQIVIQPRSKEDKKNALKYVKEQGIAEDWRLEGVTYWNPFV
ncbi:hypothetical protein AC579_2537 [Pseudocercospora musae]|uniref:Uncharacterized protein n=1 Tax=Pseudocercospora musae TaxID=113226 RepID=A0A139I0B2_9PEZI|nr:hypothetical protein AC579_2537 [Pseudocercospora musae]